MFLGLAQLQTVDVGVVINADFENRFVFDLGRPRPSVFRLYDASQCNKNDHPDNPKSPTRFFH